MLVTLLDAGALPHVVTWQGQDQINDGSGSLGAGAVGPDAAPQQVAAANAGRAGFLFQNTSANPMLLLESSALEIASAWVVMPGKFFPPHPSFPVPTGVIQVQGSDQSAENDTFAYREWVNAPNE